MKALRVQIERFTDPDVPGWVECRLIDASGRSHLFVEKVPVVSDEDLDASSSYPQEGVIGCVIVGLREDGDGGQIVISDTEKPWGVESTEGLSRFEVRSDQIVEIGKQPG